MPRVTKSNTARKKHLKVLKSTKGHYGARSRLYIRLLSNRILKPYSMHLETEKTRKDRLDLYGLQELILLQEI